MKIGQYENFKTSIRLRSLESEENSKMFSNEHEKWRYPRTVPTESCGAEPDWLIFDSSLNSMNIKINIILYTVANVKIKHRILCMHIPSINLAIQLQVHNQPNNFRATFKQGFPLTTS